ncbi:MAG: TetR/AcrR family transcriptional regulator [Deltaproteobacteria bacterium]|nr:TetR/AcrR family transcriptional regulator [Deltaproteobacteria bacterium]
MSGVLPMNADLPRRPGRPARPVTREHLLKVAREAFSQLGYAGASMGDIAGRAGIRKSSLFHHFATKDDLYREALSSVVVDLGVIVGEALNGEGAYLERLDRSILATQRYFGAHPVAARLLMREFVDGGAALTAAGDVVIAVLENTVAILETGMSQGVLPKTDARQLAISVLGVQFQFYSIPEVSARLVSADVFAPEAIERRALAVVEHLHRLLGVKS